jgi:hypothetical protein
MREKKFQDICMEIYTQMYKESTPSADIKHIIDSGEGKKSNWFMKYYLPMKRQEEIVNEAIKKHKLSKHDRKEVSQTVYLGCSPNSKEE